MEALHDAESITRFLDSPVARHTLGLVYGRRRIGKSTLLAQLCRSRGGFYWEASRGETSVQLTRLGDALGAHLGVGPIRLASWDEAIGRLLALAATGRTREADESTRGVPVVLDEFGYLLESDPTLDSTIARLLGPGQRTESSSTPARYTRLVLCGSAMALMRRLTDGQAPLRGRAALELVMHPLDFRRAATLLPAGTPLATACRVFAVIGGIVGYATDMVDDDLPRDADDFTRWITQRVISPASPLYHEAITLLAEDPTLAVASASLQHSILGVIANGAVTAGTIANALRRQVPAFDPALKRLIAAGFVTRHDDPMRGRRPVYALADPFLQFHYAVLEPHGTALRTRALRDVWERRLLPVFDARVRGPVFEEQVRHWVRRFAAPDTLGGDADQVGPSWVTVDGGEHELDVVVTAIAEGMDARAETPAARRVLAIGEAKSGETITMQHLRRLELARQVMGVAAAHAKLLLFAPAFTSDLARAAAARTDIELVDLDRLYHGA